MKPKQTSLVITATSAEAVTRKTRKIKIQGTVFPPNASPIQVFIRGGDAQWYLQGNAAVHGRHWECQAMVGPYLGDPQASGGLYAVVAVIGSKVRRGQHAPAEEIFPGNISSEWKIVIRTDKQ